MTIDVNTNQLFTFNLGRQGENGVTQFGFDYTRLVERFGNGVLSGLYQRTESEQPYPITLVPEDGIAYWMVTATDTAINGRGRLQLIYTVDGVVKKSVVHATKVGISLETSSTEPPDPYVSWLEQLVSTGARVSEEVQTAEGLVEDVTETGEQALADIRTERAGAVEDISTGRADALSDIATARTSALSAINTDRTEALEDIHTATEASLDEIQRTLTFTDDGNGNITITIGE